MPNGRRPARIQSVDRAAAILKALASGPGGWGSASSPSGSSWRVRPSMESSRRWSPRASSNRTSSPTSTAGTRPAPARVFLSRRQRAASTFDHLRGSAGGPDQLRSTRGCPAWRRRRGPPRLPTRRHASDPRGGRTVAAPRQRRGQGTPCLRTEGDIANLLSSPLQRLTKRTPTAAALRVQLEHPYACDCNRARRGGPR